MKKTMTPFLALSVAACLAIPALASVPSTAAEAKQVQPEQVAKKGKAAHPKKSKAKA